MQKASNTSRLDYTLLAGIIFLVISSVIILHSISTSIFPLYYFYLFLGGAAFFVFVQFDFEIISVFSRVLYFISIILLILPLLIGQVTRGAIRWIPIGPLTIQPAEVVRPFLLIFLSVYLAEGKSTPKRLAKGLSAVTLPLILILVQPSLGVAALTSIGFLGVLLATEVKKRYFLIAGILIILLVPIVWVVLAPYQKLRVISYLDPYRDPYGAGYNSLQAMISVGSGKLTGRGLGRGVQAQLAFLPERHTDFIFAATGEELGFVGSSLLVMGLFFILWRLIIIIENASTPAARAYVSGLFLVLFTQTMVHIGMNMGIFPITGIPLPLVSAGGSSFLATMIGLGVALGARKKILA